MVRLKCRYFLFEIVYPTSNPANQLSAKTFLNELKNEVKHNFGDDGLAKVQATLQLKYFSVLSRHGIIRVGRENASILHAALTYLSSIDGVGVVVYVRRVSGTIRSGQKALCALDTGFVGSAHLTA